MACQAHPCHADYMHAVPATGITPLGVGFCLHFCLLLVPSAPYNRGCFSDLMTYMLPANGRVFDALLQEVTDMIDKTSVAIDLVRSELKRSTATVKVSLTVPPCVQSGSVDRQQKSGSSPKSSVSPDSSNKQAQSPAQEASLVADQQQQQQQHDTKSSRSEEEQNTSRSEEEQEIACQQRTPDAESQQGHCCSCSPGRLNHDEDSCKEVLVELLSDNYQDLMIQTVWEVDKELKLARQLLGQCKESFSSLVSFYGENAQAFANDAVFWSDVVAFVQNFTACQRALRKQMQVWLSTVLPGVSFDPG